MFEQEMERLLNNKVSFLADAEPDDIAISSRIRLARNLADFSFPIAADADQLNAVRDSVAEAVRVGDALGGEPLFFRPVEMGELDREILFERRLASRDLLAREQGTAVFCRADESAAVMVNEEDHLRIQVLQPGFRLDEAWGVIDALDNQLAAHLPYAFDEHLGFLTSCPTNVGTGMRASVMLHLPGLVLTGQIQAATQGISKLNLAVRGTYGERTENLGSLYQISNQSTLGESERQIIDRLGAVIRQMIAHEKNARRMLLETDQYRLMDFVGRSYGLLRHAYRLSTKETVEALSGIRLGVDMGMFNTVTLQTVNELFINTSPAHLQKFANRTLTQTERMVQRALQVRERLKMGGVPN